MKKTRSAIAAAALLISAAPAFADKDVSVEVTNLTNGLYFTPLLIAAHRAHTDLFEVGTAASANLQAMAEGGDISGLAYDVVASGGTAIENPAGGLLAPGASATAMLDEDDVKKRRLSVVAMMLPTNDGFIGLDAVRIPKRKGVYTYYLNGYDAGTEANDEIINGGGAPGTPGIPAAPGGDGGTGGSGAAGADSNATVHIHRGALGDSDPSGGVSDLDSSIHRWLNPVARVVVTVQ